MQNIAQTIWTQINYKGRQIPWSWGVHALRALPESEVDSDGNTIKTDDDFRMGGLQFKVQGAKFKGWVRVILDWNDTYIVRFGRLNKGFKVSKEMDDIYCDMLTDVIDTYVET